MQQHLRNIQRTLDRHSAPNNHPPHNSNSVTHKETTTYKPFLKFFLTTTISFPSSIYLTEGFTFSFNFHQRPYTDESLSCGERKSLLLAIYAKQTSPIQSYSLCVIQLSNRIHPRYDPLYHQSNTVDS